jgi:hypothetical protein
VNGRAGCVRVDGQRIEGTLVPLAPAGTTVQVDVLIDPGGEDVL